VSLPEPKETGDAYMLATVVKRNDAAFGRTFLLEKDWVMKTKQDKTTVTEREGGGATGRRSVPLRWSADHRQLREGCAGVRRRAHGADPADQGDAQVRDRGVGDERTPLFRRRFASGPCARGEPAFAPKNRYETAEDLGQRRPMGKVARGVDSLPRQAVAFKRSLDGSTQMLEALLNEAEIAARLDHPSIVTIHDVAYDEHDEPFVVMRLVDGQPLSLVLEGADLAARLRLLPRVVSAIEAVAYAHTQGVVHRDPQCPTTSSSRIGGDTVVMRLGPRARHARRHRSAFEGSSVSHSRASWLLRRTKRAASVQIRVSTSTALGVTLFFLLSGKLPGDARARHSRPSRLAYARDLVTKSSTRLARSNRAARYPTATETSPPDLDPPLHRRSSSSPRIATVSGNVSSAGSGFIASRRDRERSRSPASVTVGIISLRSRARGACARRTRKASCAPRLAERREADRGRSVARRSRTRGGGRPIHSARKVSLLHVRLGQDSISLRALPLDPFGKQPVLDVRSMRSGDDGLRPRRSSLEGQHLEYESRSC